MSIESNPELLRRAAVHAALADPGRLAIVDTLLHSDASPSELQSRISMSSNLLAHHLRVLEQAGVVCRSRSEGDRRRTYLSVIPTSLESLIPAHEWTAGRIVFVCSENAARSQLAVAVWNRRRRAAIPAVSAGTHPARHVHPGALAAAKRRRLPMRPHRPRRLDDVLARGDFVIAVCDNAHEELPAGMHRVHWSIPDPARTNTEEAFERTLDELTERIVPLTATLTLRSATESTS